MNPHSPLPRLVAVALALIVLATACGGSDTVSTSDPSPIPTEAPMPTPEPDPTPEPPPEQPAEDHPVLFTVFATGGFVPVEFALGEFPELVVLPDGTAYRRGAQIAVFPPPLAPAVERLQLDEDQLARIRAAIAESGAIDPAADFGQPNVTDLPTTNVSAVVDGELRQVGVYALGFDEGMDGEAAANRRAVSGLIATVSAIVDEAIATGELAAPPALAIRTFPSLVADETAEVREWPIASVPQDEGDGRGCVVIDGEEMETLLDAVGNASTQTPWQIGDQAVPVILRPVFPHEDIC